MDLRSELLKSIWYGFTALDLEKSGKVSKSQLKVLSHNLCTVLCIPHDPVALEEHFRDDDDGPVSSQGYMPYLNKYILDKVVEGSFNKENVDELCWTLTAKKNYQTDKNSNTVLPERDAFRLWCLFNFLSEDKYPLVMVPDEVEYLLKKICMAMSIEFNCVELEDFFSQDSVQQSGITVWVFLEMMNSGKTTRGIDKSIISMAIEEVYREIVGDVLKEGYLWKKGQLRRNWKERWFTLRPSNLSYYTGEDRKDCQGNIALDGNCCVEEVDDDQILFGRSKWIKNVLFPVLPDRDGKRCMFCLKTLSKTYEMSASDTKQRQEWTTAIQTAIRLHVEGKNSLHKDLKLKRREQREQREKRRQAKEEELQRLRALQEERERKLAELELLKEAQKQAQALLEQDEQRRRQQHEQLQQALEIQLREAEEARVSMQAEMALKEEEAERQRKRIQELEEMQKRLEEALQQEIKARLDEEAFRYAQTGLLAEEEEKMKALMALQEEQEEYILKTQREKQELKQEMEAKSRALEEAQKQLEEVRANRHRVDQDVVAAQRKLRQASTNVKHWNVQMNRLMRPIGPGEKRPSLGSSFSSFQIPTQRDPGLRLRRSGSEDQDEESKENVDNRAGRDLEKRHSHASNGDMDIP
ncbi:differentially expressed in FDCP 6 homolog isoform X1 [Xiphias gladius]|uniref:differentially expressed in FDCP 6 homolog isoform X1 n=1 Tax=Xiphias gladius TaxID=8245 RepID=UPI001A984169|nr:differentially expressed in FDCP 6 homolog isoform X1 [Xiphias gladius]XP_040009605.1 differentially expressed in FDCP 6 homolog isoform X1 [Xiphias gladius]XP_040009606.1 differentially expressed in FDCP 6 homolog isoform X1 [Xiphias gladius]XP_040009607.1 differentially expressed in FDCP 6 homolog isoform X1 [Xiphias gladius]